MRDRRRNPVPKPDAQRLSRVRDAITALDYICSGTLHRRMKMCGKAQCPCARDPKARHGPYYQWSRREGGRQVHTIVPPELVPRFRDAVKNYRELRRCLRTWERESVAALLATQTVTRDE